MFDHDNITRTDVNHNFSNGHNKKVEEEIVFQIDFDNFIIRNLDIREMIVLQMILSGFNQFEIAAHQGIARETINRLIKVIRQKFKLFFQGQ